MIVCRTDWQKAQNVTTTLTDSKFSIKIKTDLLAEHFGAWVACLLRWCSRVREGKRKAPGWKKLFSREKGRVRLTPKPSGKRKSGRDGRTTAVQFTLHYVKRGRMRVRREERLRLAFRDEWCWKEEEQLSLSLSPPPSLCLSLFLSLSLLLRRAAVTENLGRGAEQCAVTHRWKKRNAG